MSTRPTKRAGKDERRPLKDQERAFIVMCLARYMTVQETVKAFQEAFNHPVEALRVRNYNYDVPSRSGHHGHQKWKKLWDDTREKFLAEIDAIPVTHKAYRLAKMQKYFDKLDAKDAIGPAMAVLEQVAKEVGGNFTNKREVAGKIKVESEAIAPDTGEKRALLIAAIEEAMAAHQVTEQDTRH